MSSSADSRSTNPLNRFHIDTIQVADIRVALLAGVKDFWRRPALSGFFGLVYAVFGLLFTVGLIVFDQIWMVVPVAVGFPLIAPFIAAGLYEMSRRFESGQPFSWRDIFLVVVKQQRREFGWMAFVVLFVFWVWIYQVRLLLALFLQWQSFSSLSGFLDILATTNGILFLSVGTIVSALLATVLFSVTVVSMPILLDQEIDFVSAMILSVKTVLANPLVMLTWGAIVAVLVLLAMVPAFLGVVFVLPVLGHTTWHLYKRTVLETQPNLQN